MQVTEVGFRASMVQAENIGIANLSLWDSQGQAVWAKTVTILYPRTPGEYISIVGSTGTLPVEATTLKVSSSGVTQIDNALVLTSSKGTLELSLPTGDGIASEWLLAEAADWWQNPWVLLGIGGVGLVWLTGSVPVIMGRKRRGRSRRR